MISLTPISITATSQQYTSSITEYLCQPYCLAQSIQPIANVNYSVYSTNTVDGITYVTIQAVGSIQYQPNGSCGCNPQVKMFTESFDIAFAGTGIPTIEVAYTQGINSPSDVRRNGAVYSYNIVGAVLITATFPT